MTVKSKKVNVNVQLKNKRKKKKIEKRLENYRTTWRGMLVARKTIPKRKRLAKLSSPRFDPIKFAGEV